MASNKTTPPDETILDLEERLAGTLKPIQPPRETVQRLRGRIYIPDRDEITLRFHDWKRMFLVFGGVMSGLLLLITLARAFFYLVGRRQV